MNKTAVHTITSTLTPRRLMAAFDVSDHMIRHIRTTGAFPGSWFFPVKVMCEAEGIECPEDAFTWKPVRPETHGNPLPGFQPEQTDNLTDLPQS